MAVELGSLEVGSKARFWDIARMLPVRLSRATSAVAKPDSSPGGIVARSSSLAAAWAFTSSVVMMFKPPRYSRLRPSPLKASSLPMTLVT